MYKGLIDKYQQYLPVNHSTPIISLQEGNTPLIQADNVCKKYKLDVNLYLKYEGLNPTGSFKDRGMTVAISKAAEENKRAVICASTGNTSASAAAYAARAGMKCFVIIPEGKIAEGKLAQAIMHGAIVLQIQGNFDQGLEFVKQLAGQLPLTIVNSINPYRIPGQRTAAFEIVEQLGNIPDYHCIPVGNAANIVAYWQGYKLVSNNKLPKMLGYQAEGAAPFIHGRYIDSPDTIATAIRIGHPQSWDLANEASKQSNGWFSKLQDSDIIKAQSDLASLEGVFAEPASAAAVAGFIHDARAGKIKPYSSVVCTLTGHGLKDPQVVKYSKNNVQLVTAKLDDLKMVIDKFI